jgi:hypothetical protein
VANTWLGILIGAVGGAVVATIANFVRDWIQEGWRYKEVLLPARMKATSEFVALFAAWERQLFDDAPPGDWLFFDLFDECSAGYGRAYSIDDELVQFAERNAVVLGKPTLDSWYKWRHIIKWAGKFYNKEKEEDKRKGIWDYIRDHNSKAWIDLCEKTGISLKSGRLETVSLTDYQKMERESEDFVKKDLGIYLENRNR